MPKMTNANRVIVAMLAIAALAAAFWILLLSPKRDEVAKLDAQAKELRASLAQHRSEIALALDAKAHFASDYQQLVVLGKAVPGDDETPSLLVQLNRIAKRSKVRFDTFTLTPGGGGGATSAPPPPSSPEAGGTSGTGSSKPVSATEAAASTTPLGAAIGPAGLAVMPYTLTFKGSFFRLGDFIKGLDSLVTTNNSKVAVNGRLITIDGFSLAGDKNKGFPQLEATFGVTTYLTPPDQGLAAGAAPSGPGASTTGTPASATTGGAE